jgi:catechol 2,3-dioxygenase-like lactoylglutathione lyase family enzyme
MADITGKVTTVMVDTVDLDASAVFWSEFLGLEEVYRNDTYVYLSPMSEGGPHLAFQLVDEPRPGKNRLHLDIQVDDRVAATDQIIAAGGSFIAQVDEPGFPVWSVMADPQGNEFDIYESQAAQSEAAGE